MAAGSLELARHYLQMRRYEQALESLGGDEPHRADVWRIRAAALHGLRRHAEAVEAAERGLAASPDDVRLLDQLALSAFADGDEPKAQIAIARALELEPDDALLIAHHALFLARTKRSRLSRRKTLRLAMGEADRAASLAPEHVQVIRIRALVAGIAQDPRADEFRRQLLALDPDNSQAQLVSGVVSVRTRKVDDALEHYVTAARLNPGDARTAWFGRRGRALMHPVAAPWRLVMRLGGIRRVRWYVLGLWVLLMVVHEQTPATILLACWLAYIVYTYVFVAGLRVRHGRRPD